MIECLLIILVIIFFSSSSTATPGISLNYECGGVISGVPVLSNELFPFSNELSNPFPVSFRAFRSVSADAISSCSASYFQMRLPNSSVRESVAVYVLLGRLLVAGDEVGDGSSDAFGRNEM